MHIYNIKCWILPNINKIQIFNSKFVRKNQIRCRIIYENKLYPLQDVYSIKENKTTTLKIKLICFDKIYISGSIPFNPIISWKLSERKKAIKTIKQKDQINIKEEDSNKKEEEKEDKKEKEKKEEEKNEEEYLTENENQEINKDFYNSYSNHSINNEKKEKNISDIKEYLETMNSKPEKKDSLKNIIINKSRVSKAIYEVNPFDKSIKILGEQYCENNFDKCFIMSEDKIFSLRSSFSLNIVKGANDESKKLEIFFIEMDLFN